MKIWKIYLRKDSGKQDETLITTVEARTAKEALELATKQVHTAGVRLRAVEDDYRRCDYCGNTAYAEDISSGKTVVEVCPNCRDIGI